MKIELNKPLTPDLHKLTTYLNEVNESGWYTNFGLLHQKLTDRLETFLGVKNLLLVSNGTIALQVAAKTLDINKALTTPFSFVATSSALLWQGVELAYCDIDEYSYNLSPQCLASALEQDSSFDGIVATHVYGNPCAVKNIEMVAKLHNQKVIYDAAHAFGVNIDGESLLQFGDASTLSFHATKLFHTVEGGAIVFKNRIDYEKARRLINFGIDTDSSIEGIGINGKLNEYQCAVGLALLDDLEQVLLHRRQLFEAYCDQLSGVVEMPKWHESANKNGAYMPIYISDVEKQQELLEELGCSQVHSKRYFTPSLDTVFLDCHNYGCFNSHKKASGVICLPLHNYMTQEQVSTVCNLIKNVMMNK